MRKLRQRWMFEGPDWDGHLAETGSDFKWVRSRPHRIRWSRKFSGGHGGDEYGNCSVYFRTCLFGIVLFYGRHFQTDVELPEIGECPWTDRVFYEC